MDDGQPPVFSAATFFSALLKQLYLDQSYVPKHIYVPVDFADRALLADALREKIGHRIEIAAPQRGERRSLVDLVCQNAKQSYDQRFRVLKPSIQKMQEALQDALMLAEPPERIECFDISHIQGADTVASMVVWEKGAMKKSDYRKFQVKTVTGVDDFASMREIIHRRYLAAAGRQQADAVAGADRWRYWAAARGGGGAGGDWADDATAGLDREARGDYLRAWAGG